MKNWIILKDQLNCWFWIIWYWGRRIWKYFFQANCFQNKNEEYLFHYAYKIWIVMRVFVFFEFFFQIELLEYAFSYFMFNEWLLISTVRNFMLKCICTVIYCESEMSHLYEWFRFSEYFFKRFLFIFLDFTWSIAVRIIIWIY